jgi:hypothetical protein
MGKIPAKAPNGNHCNALLVARQKLVSADPTAAKPSAASASKPSPKNLRAVEKKLRPGGEGDFSQAGPF